MKKLVTDILLELHVPDFEPAKEFYGWLGYEVVWEKPSDNREGYLVMRKGNSILNFYCGNEKVYDHTFFGHFPSDTPRGYGVEIILPVDDIDVEFARFKEKYPDQVVAEPPGRFSHKDFRVTDPFGYYLRFVERYNWVDGRDKQGNPL